jgi:hypothetical protein
MEYDSAAQHEARDVHDTPNEQWTLWRSGDDFLVLCYKRRDSSDPAIGDDEIGLFAAEKLKDLDPRIGRWPIDAEADELQSLAVLVRVGHPQAAVISRAWERFIQSHYA